MLCFSYGPKWIEPDFALEVRFMEENADNLLL